MDVRNGRKGKTRHFAGKRPSRSYSQDIHGYPSLPCENRQDFREQA
jgi:hypothetical protein